MVLKLYRHKDEKNIYLARNWSYCGGNEHTPFYYATRDIITAIRSANDEEPFERWFTSFCDERGTTKLKARMIDKKSTEIDGYIGVLEKQLSFNVADFECVMLGEVEIMEFQEVIQKWQAESK